MDFNYCPLQLVVYKVLWKSSMTQESAATELIFHVFYEWLYTFNFVMSINVLIRFHVDPNFMSIGQV